MLSNALIEFVVGLNLDTLFFTTYGTFSTNKLLYYKLQHDNEMEVHYLNFPYIHLEFGNSPSDTFCVILCPRETTLSSGNFLQSGTALMSGDSGHVPA